VRGIPREHQVVRPGSPSWDQGGRRKKAAGPRDEWKSPDKSTGKLGRLGPGPLGRSHQ